MRRAGVIVLLPLFVLLVLTPLAAADDTLPPDLRVIANDEYTREIRVAESGSFAWSLVNVGNTSVNVTAFANVSASEYGLRVEPGRATLGPGEIVTFYANVTVPATPTTPTADIDVTIVLDDGRHVHLDATVTARVELQLIDLITAFLAIGAIIFIGFFATLVFERTKVPDLVFLILLGLILGPILVTFFSISLVPVNLLKLATPYFAALALMIILFDGGLNLNIRQVVSSAGITVFHTAVTWTVTVALVTLLAVFLLGYPLWVGVLLGTVIGGTSGAVVIAVVRGMSIKEDTRTILVLESTITDVLCIVGALAVIGILQGGGTLSGTLGGLLTTFSVALLLGFVTGVLWLRVLSGMQGKPFGFMITIAALFILYAGTEFLGGSGGVAALVFGLILGNHKEVGRALRIKEAFKIDEQFKQFESEISFVVRTFFFVFLGFTFTLPFAANWAVETDLPVFSVLNNTFWLVLLAIALMIAGIYVVRLITSMMTTLLHPESRPDRSAMTAMMGRGLAAAVLASLPFAIGVFTDPTNPDYLRYHSAMAPYEVQFLTIAFLVILLTVLATSIGVVASERRRVPEGFGKAATASLGEVMQEQTRQAKKDLAKKQRVEQRRRLRELRRIEKQLRKRKKQS